MSLRGRRSRERYGYKRWCIFEASKYADRIEKGEVIPICSTKVPQSAFDKIRNRGATTFDPDGDLEARAKQAAEVIAKKLGET